MPAQSHRLDIRANSLWRLTFPLVLLLGLVLTTAAKKGKNESQSGADLSLPADLNQASLRVAAVEQLYEMDASPEQLRNLRSSATPAAGSRARAPARGTAKLSAALKEYYDVLLAGKDDAKISAARNQLTELSNDDNVQLDDEPEPTAAARALAGQMQRQFKSSQIAAYLASHADQVSDPVEQMMGALDDLRAGSGEDADSLISRTGEEVGYLVAGMDQAAAKALAGRVIDWIKANRQTAENSEAARNALEESAKKVVGDVSPVDVLDHWLENEMAELLSNPQLTGAVDAMLANRDGVLP